MRKHLLSGLVVVCLLRPNRSALLAVIIELIIRGETPYLARDSMPILLEDMTAPHLLANFPLVRQLKESKIWLVMCGNGVWTNMMQPSTKTAQGMIRLTFGIVMFSVPGWFGAELGIVDGFSFDPRCDSSFFRLIQAIPSVFASFDLLPEFLISFISFTLVNISGKQTKIGLIWLANENFVLTPISYTRAFLLLWVLALFCLFFFTLLPCFNSLKTFYWRNRMRLSSCQWLLGWTPLCGNGWEWRSSFWLWQWWRSWCVSDTRECMR